MIVGSSLRFLGCAALSLASGTSAFSVVAPLTTTANAPVLGDYLRQRISPNHVDPFHMTTSTTTMASFVPTAEKRVTWTMSSTDGGTTVIERPETVEKRKVKDEDKVQKDEKGYESGWEVRLYNDPMNKREFVARCLSEICGLSDGAAYDTMMQAHLNGRAVIGRYIYERAEMYYVSLQDHGLSVDMVPVDNN